MRSIELPARVPELLGVSVESVTEIEGGCDYAVFEIDGEWIVRVPRRPEVRARLQKEARLLPELPASLPLPVPTFEVSITTPISPSSRIDGSRATRSTSACGDPS